MNKRKTKGPAKKYPFMAFRPSKPTQDRLRAFAARTGLKMSTIMAQCIDKELPRREKAWEK